MTDEECRELGIMTETELKEMDDRLNKVQEVGLSDLVKYFDRIHDKIFQLNTIIIGGYFALIAIQPKTSVWFITIPILNFFILLYVDYRMMEKSRLESNIKNLGPDKLKRHGELVESTTLY